MVLSAAKKPTEASAEACRVCGVTGQAMESIGGFRKQCVDKTACTQRAKEQRSASARPHCVFCGAADQRLTGDGMRKRCADETSCARRVRGESTPPSRAQMLRAVPSPAAGTQGDVRATQRKREETPAEAMIALMQEAANISEWDGPVHLTDDFNLPLRALQCRYLMLGKTGSGKTGGLTVIAESCLLNDVPVCVIDYLGNYHGLRADGEDQGSAFEIVIVGGPFGDVPLQTEDAAAIAQIFADGNSVVIDLSDWGVEEQQYFTAAFFTELLRVLRRPAHVIVDEAETAAPAFSRSKAQFAAQGATLRFVRQIRRWGVGWTFASQEPGLVHPNLVNSANVFLAMQSTGDATQRAIGKESGTRVGSAVSSAILSELGRLAPGQTWLIADAGSLGEDSSALPVRFRFRRRYTFDSTQVPQIGEKAPEPPKMMAVALGPFASLRRDESTGVGKAK